MKKLWILLIIVFLFTGCSNLESTHYDATNINVRYSDTMTVINQLTNEESSEFVSFLNNLDWRSDVTKTYCAFVFDLSEGILIHYSSEAGVFNDRNNNRSVCLSEEERIYINSLIDIEDHLALESSEAEMVIQQIVAGKTTYAEVKDLIGIDGTDIGSGAIIYEWNVEEGEVLRIWFKKPEGVDFMAPDDLIVVTGDIYHPETEQTT